MSARTLIGLIAALLAAACSTGSREHVADVVILNGAVMTMNPAQPEATALAIRGGRIVFVGNDEGAEEWVGKETRVLRVEGNTVLPGLIDTHIHLMEGALSYDACTFGDALLTLEQMKPIILDCAARPPAQGWVVVQNLNGAGFQAKLSDLDAIVPDRPLLLWGADGHTAWVNSAALKLAGITRSTPDPDGGRIDRGPDGAATGLLVDEALGFVTSLLEQPSPEQRQKVLLRALHELAAAGITTFLEANTSAETIDTYVELARAGKVPARVTFALSSEGANTDEEFARLKKLRDLAQSQPQFEADVIKLFADGVMEYPLQTAAMLEPYTDAKGKPTKNSGQLYYDTAHLSTFTQRADREGFALHIHAIGDRAVRAALDAFAAARGQGSKRSYSIAHLELVDPQDLPRFKELDVYPSVQLLWARPDNYTEEALRAYTGEERHGRLYPARSFVAAGATVVGGSDWNVSSFNPFEAIATAMSRRNPDEPNRGVLNSGEALSLREMLAAYTINAARMLGREDEVGSLATGKAANVVVLDRHLDDGTPAEQVYTTKVLYTFNDGAMLIGEEKTP